MSKRSEYNIEFKFYTSEDGIKTPILDTKNSEDQCKPLYFINCLQKFEVQCLVEDIDRISSGHIYDPDFLTSSEIYAVFNVRFINPDFWIEGHKAIDMFDLKMLLQEWIAFLEEFEKKQEPKQSDPSFFKKLINKFKLI